MIDLPTKTKPALSQALWLLQIFDANVQSEEQFEAFRSSNLLMDLLKADPAKIDRMAFRKLLGLPISPWRILVGDPRWGLEKALTHEGHYAKAVRSMSAYGSTTIEDFMADDFNLVILHPWEDSMSKQTCEEIKRLKPSCKIILMVTYDCKYEDEPHDATCELGAPYEEIFGVMAKLQP